MKTVLCNGGWDELPLPLLPLEPKPEFEFRPVVVPPPATPAASVTDVPFIFVVACV